MSARNHSPRHRCDVPRCGYATDRSNNLARHKKIHERLRSAIVCCQHAFWTQFDARSHRKQVHSEADYYCQFCERPFSRPGALTRHLTIHTGERKFVCSVAGCRYTSNSKSNAKRHERAIHGITNVRVQSIAKGRPVQQGGQCGFDEEHSPGTVGAAFSGSPLRRRHSTVPKEDLSKNGGPSGCNSGNDRLSPLVSERDAKTFECAHTLLYMSTFVSIQRA
ncbi:putative zinc finger protein 66 [Ixodes scapularis]|uniref:putative zinc finger protein 66 n=1 Tax=Ixodes scapularis TaxID=6945 RepID=UPI001AD63A7B|nr:putative zinc finger protein 66 [Ixodes scapularis]